MEKSFIKLCVGYLNATPLRKDLIKEAMVEKVLKDQGIKDEVAFTLLLGRDAWQEFFNLYMHEVLAHPIPMVKSTFVPDISVIEKKLIPIEYIELRHQLTGELLEAHGITDCYANVQMTYNQKGDIKLEQVPEYYREYVSKAVAMGTTFNIEAEAKDLPDIGEYKCFLKKVEVA